MMAIFPSPPFVCANPSEMNCEVNVINPRETTRLVRMHVERTYSADGLDTRSDRMRKRSSSRLNLGFTSLNSGPGSGYIRRDSHSGVDALSPMSPTNSPPRSRRGSRATSPAGRREAKHTSPHSQRRSCPPSPSASFVSLTQFQPPMLPRQPGSQQSQKRTRTRSNTSTSPATVQEHPRSQGFFGSTPTPAPVCIRSRSSSYPHLPSFGSSDLPPRTFTGKDNKNGGDFPGSPQSLCFGAGASLARAPSFVGPSSPSAPFFQVNPGYLSIGQRRMDVEDSDGDQEPLVFGRQIHQGTSSIGRIRSRTHISRGHVTETETEREGPPRVLPTARGPTHHQPSATPLMSRLIPLLMLSLRLLAIVPATIGTVIHLHNAIHPPNGTAYTRIDSGVAACWSVLTGFQCWFLTCGLLQRWRAYYPLLSTIVRLLALQAICWPATHITLSVLDVQKRPAACWAVVGTTTCVSRAIQLWATSNLGPVERGQRVIYGRKWDWGDVALKCGLPCSIVYFVMAWGAVFNRELGLC